MLRVAAAQQPDRLPYVSAMRSFGDNSHGYEPEFWEFQYETYRYLSRISDAELSDRHSALVRNMHTLVRPDRHIIPIQNYLSSWYWFRKEHQTRMEFALRGNAVPVPPPEFTGDVAEVSSPESPTHPSAGDRLFRYGSKDYLKPMIEHGHVRINPAFSYQNEQLGKARADEESAKHLFMPGQYSTVTTEAGTTLPIKGNVQRTVSVPDYYMLCSSWSWDAELLSDFNADACVVVHQPEAFAKRLNHTAQQTLENWWFNHCSVAYFDPHEPTRNQDIVAGLCKDFRFAYQREYRHLWMPPEGQKASGWQYLELGPLTDIAELRAI